MITYHEHTHATFAPSLFPRLKSKLYGNFYSDTILIDYKENMCEEITTVINTEIF